MVIDPNNYCDPGVLQGILNEGQQLHEQLPTIKTHTAKELVEEHEIRIERYCNLLSTADDALARKIDELRAWRGTLGLMEKTQKTDKKEARNYMFHLIQELKESRYRSQP